MSVNENTPYQDKATQYAALGEAGYIQVEFDEFSGGYLVIHPDHGQNEWEENKQIGRLLVALGDCVLLLPNQPEKNSCDAIRNGEEWEFKTIRSENVSRALQQALRRGKNQSSAVLCYISVKYFKLYEVTLAIYNAVKFDQNQQLQKIGILFFDGTLVEVNRTEVTSKMYIQKFSL